MSDRSVDERAIRDRRAARSNVLLAGSLVFTVLSIALVAFAVKVGTPPRYYDEEAYLEIARNISEGEGFSLNGVPTANRPPAWPLILAVCLVAGLPAGVLPAVSALLLVVGAIAAAYIGVHLSESRWGAVAGLLVLLYPLNVYSATTLYPQTAATAILLLLWAIATRTAGRTSRRLPVAISAVVGLLLAALVLAVPTLILTGFAIGMWFWWQQRGNRLRYLAVAGICAAVPVLAWTARNSIELDSPVMFSTTSGWNLLQGNNAEATGDSGVTAEFPETVSAAAAMTEVERDAYYRDAAIDWISSHPGDAARLYGAKVINYFAPYNAPATESQGGGAVRAIAIASFVAVGAATVCRVLMRSRVPLRSTEWLFLTLFFANALTMAVFFTRTRFRQPLDNVLVVEAGVAVAIVIALTVRQTRRHVG